MSWPDVLTYSGIVTSVLVVPGALTYYFTQYGAPGDGLAMAVVGLVALLPGPVMGATALWVAARG